LTGEKFENFTMLQVSCTNLGL